MIKEIVNKAYNFSYKKHYKQVRKFTRIPYFTHPKAVARIIEKITDDSNLVAASLLHDIVENTRTNIDEIKKIFGDKISNIVNELTLKDFEKKEKGKFLYSKLRKISDDALLIKLADRYHNLLYLERDCNGSDEGINFIKRYVLETIRILRNIQYDRKLNRKHEIILTNIYIIIDFLKLMYKINED